MKSSQNVLTPDSDATDFVAVAPAEPPAGWVGGKRNLAKRICAIIAQAPHRAYVEPFAGMGGVFLRRRQKPQVEVINDISGDVVNLFRVLRSHPEALLRELRWRPAMREEWERLKRDRGADLTDIERAACFLYLQRLAYRGNPKLTAFSSPWDTFDLGAIALRIERMHDRLAGVVVDNLDWADCLGFYDGAQVLFYLDPPYWGTEAYYIGNHFGRADFERLAERLKTIDGRFLLSINDVPEIRALFSWADMEAVTTTYTLGPGASDTSAAELLIGKGVDLAAAAAQPALF